LELLDDVHRRTFRSFLIRRARRTFVRSSQPPANPLKLGGSIPQPPKLVEGGPTRRRIFPPARPSACRLEKIGTARRRQPFRLGPPPRRDAGMIAGQQHLGDRPPFPDLWPRVLR